MNYFLPPNQYVIRHDYGIYWNYLKARWVVMDEASLYDLADAENTRILLFNVFDNVKIVETNVLNRNTHNVIMSSSVNKI